jgi:hypothetical protein
MDIYSPHSIIPPLNDLETRQAKVFCRCVYLRNQWNIIFVCIPKDDYDNFTR